MLGGGMFGPGQIGPGPGGAAAGAAVRQRPDTGRRSGTPALDKFGRDLTAWLVDPGGRLSSAGRIAWALAVGLVALAATAPRPPLG